MSEKAKRNKYLYVSVLQSNYGEGWFDESSYNERDELEMKDLQRDLLFTKNIKGAFRVIHRRILNEQYY